MPVLQTGETARARARRLAWEELPGLGRKARIGVSTGQVVTGNAQRLRLRHGRPPDHDGQVARKHGVP
jgi:hypothetical protein